MKTQTLAMFVLSMMAASLTFGQSIPIGDLQLACKTLAALTAEATKANNLSDVILYKRAADRIREHLLGGCEATYFGAVMALNHDALKATGIYLSIDATKPIKGWTHDEIDKFLEKAESDGPAKILSRLEVTDPLYTIDLDKINKLSKDMQILKKNRPDLFDTRQPPSP
ncbi:MAG TPA: hypothetical protein VGQ65_06110 [Thermoanaerobaculia bacterium]|jgi:hypothetical protein|nr:hypothetical protein [Thermoanaerobaculia bacterium]